jgi:hypothetical protein
MVKRPSKPHVFALRSFHIKMEAGWIVMKRIMLRLSVALIAFWVGVGCELASKRFFEPTCLVDSDPFPNQRLLIRISSGPLEQSETQLPPGSLPIVLQKIDDKYKRQCQLPTNWDGEWPTVKQLAEFRRCNDKWANARRKAIDSEIANYLVQY